MAVKKHWGGMPLPGLLDALKARDGVVLRVDDDHLPDDKRFRAGEKQANRLRDRYSTSGVSKTSWTNCRVTIRFGLQFALSRAPAHRRAALRAGRPPHGVLPRIDAGCPGSGKLATFVKVSPSSRKTSTSLSTKFAT